MCFFFPENIVLTWGQVSGQTGWTNPLGTRSPMGLPSGFLGAWLYCHKSKEQFAESGVVAYPIFLLMKSSYIF